MAKTRVLIADDHAVLRAGLRMLLNAQPDMEVVDEAADSREALTKVRELRPHVLTLDLTMPGGGSVKLIEQIREECPQTRVVVLTMHDDPAYLRAVLAAGGAGYVVKSAADAELLTAIRATMQGRIYVNLPHREGAAANAAGSASDRQLPQKAGMASLSLREREVLGYLGRGHTNQEIATKLFLSVKTVETYRARLLAKLGLKTRADLVRYAQEVGLTDENAAPGGADAQ